MSKPDLLTILQLLSAMEAILIASKCNAPDYVYERLAEMTARIEEEILKP